MTSEFDFRGGRVQFLVDVMHKGEKQHYRMDSEFEEIESVKLVAVEPAPTRALLLQVSNQPFTFLVFQYWLIFFAPLYLNNLVVHIHMHLYRCIHIVSILYWWLTLQFLASLSCVF